MSLIETKEPTSEAEMRASVKALRAKFGAYREPPPKPSRFYFLEKRPAPAVSRPLKPADAVDIIDLPHTNRWPKVLVPLTTKPRLWIGEIQQVVAKFYGITINDLLSPRRTPKICRPRQIAMYLAKELTLRSYPEIGRKFGGKDHTTVLSAIRKITRLLETDAELKADIGHLTALLKGDAAT